MPMGKGTYGSKVGRPSKEDKANPMLKKMAMKKMAKKKKKSLTGTFILMDCVYGVMVS